MCRRTLCTFFALLATLSLASAAWAQSQVRIVRLSYIEGDVKLDRDDGQGFSQAFLNMPIVAGASLSTDADGYAEAELEDGSAIRLAPNSVMNFPQLERDNTGTQTTVELARGEAYFHWKQNRDDVLRVRVNDQLFTAKKKSRFRLAVNENDSSLAVFDGKLDMFRSNGQRVELSKNETLSLSFDDFDRYFLTKAIAPDALDTWDSDRQSDLEREKEIQAGSYANLNRYGSYMSVPDYGSVWRPTGFGYDWDPYQDGSWIWYPASGYVWVSSYPWGWAPYRYGSWVYVNNIGWCWHPAPFGSVWNSGPVFVHPPGGFLPPRPPLHHRDGVVVVGRPPGDFDPGFRRHHDQPGLLAGPAPVQSRTPITSTGAAAINSNIGNDPRPIRTSHDTTTPEPAVHHGDARPQRQPAPATSQATTPPPAPSNASVPRTERSGRVSPDSSAGSTPARSYTPPPQQSAPSSPPPQQHYSPPPSSPSPASAPPQSAPGRSESSGGRPPKI